LFLDAYRTDGAGGLKVVVKAYQEGYNARAAELGATCVGWEQIKAAILWGMKWPTAEEREAMPEAM
jgi:hypothetical protein